MTVDRIRGSITALITPMQADGGVDQDRYAAFMDWQITEGTQGLVPMGTTGESATLSHSEHEKAIRLCVEVTAGRVPVIAGTGSNSTEEAVSLSLAAQKAGADALLVVTPYYNKPTQAGLIAHYRAIHDATNLPIIIYNIPGRSVVNMSVETMATLSKLERIVGVKDATADLVRPIEQRLASGPDFIQLSGEDASILPFMGAGGHGCISVTSNVAPRLCAEFHAAWAGGDHAQAQAINDRLMPLHDALFVESNPVPAKYALQLLGRVQPGLRLPLVPLSEASEQRVRDALVQIGLLN
ncbi:MAG: 4-hydroxy-tetrahydrodipicolinate synthase [Alphaproteobacteria bacterium]|nr:4-hydroxy-tetrahydrodipicolinate synthase [Alphaproteobacteria bacterium]